MKYIVIILLSLLFLGCASVEKQHFKATQFFLSNNGKLAELCASEFPSETKYIKGDEVVKYDTIINHIEVFVDCPDGTKVKCPENKTVYKTIYQTDTIVKPNTALEAKLRAEINDLQANNTILYKENESLLNQSKKDKRTIYVLGFFLGFAIIVILKK